MMKNFNKKDAINILGSRSRLNSSCDNNNGVYDSQNNTNTKKRNNPSKWDRFIDKMKDINEYVIPVLKEITGMFISVVSALKSQRPIYVNYAR